MRKVIVFLFDLLTLQHQFTFRQVLWIEMVSFIGISLAAGRAWVLGNHAQETQPMCIFASIGALVAIGGLLLPKKWFGH